MWTPRALKAAVLSAAVVMTMSFAAPAQAGISTITDNAGDAGGPARLDIVAVKVNNAEGRIVTRVRFAERVAGSVIVSVDPRDAKGVRLVAIRKKDGTRRSYLLPGAFTNRDDPGSAVTCRGKDMKVRWRAKAVRLVLPSACLHEGEYGAIRFAVLTENGSDSDYAPHTGASRWLPRG